MLGSSFYSTVFHCIEKEVNMYSLIFDVLTKVYDAWP
jgi:hypothetical protein